MNIQKIIIALVFILGCLLINPWANQISDKAKEPVEVQKVDVNKMSYQQMIDYIAPQFNQDPYYIKKIVWNESNFKIQSHDGGRARNITATHDNTFKGWLPEYEKERGETLDINSQYDQIKMMSFAFSKGYSSQWSTDVACKSPNGTYTFISRTLGGKQFTVKCKELPKEYI